MILNRWNCEKHIYEPYKVPDEWKCLTFERDLNEEVNCPHCGRVIKFGDSYTSLEFHTEAGFGFTVCEKCYEKEWERRHKYKKEEL